MSKKSTNTTGSDEAADCGSAKGQSGWSKKNHYTLRSDSSFKEESEDDFKEDSKFKHKKLTVASHQESAKLGPLSSPNDNYTESSLDDDLYGTSELYLRNLNYLRFKLKMLNVSKDNQRESDDQSLSSENDVQMRSNLSKKFDRSSEPCSSNHCRSETTTEHERNFTGLSKANNIVTPSSSKSSTEIYLPLKGSAQLLYATERLENNSTLASTDQSCPHSEECELSESLHQLFIKSDYCETESALNSTRTTNTKSEFYEVPSKKQCLRVTTPTITLNSSAFVSKMEDNGSVSTSIPSESYTVPSKRACVRKKTSRIKFVAPKVSDCDQELSFFNCSKCKSRNLSNSSCWYCNKRIERLCTPQKLSKESISLVENVTKWYTEKFKDSPVSNKVSPKVGAFWNDTDLSLNLPSSSNGSQKSFLINVKARSTNFSRSSNDSERSALLKKSPIIKYPLEASSSSYCNETSNSIVRRYYETTSDLSSNLNSTPNYFVSTCASSNSSELNTETSKPSENPNQLQLVRISDSKSKSKDKIYNVQSCSTFRKRIKANKLSKEDAELKVFDPLLSSSLDMPKRALYDYDFPAITRLINIIGKYNKTGIFSRKNSEKLKATSDIVVGHVSDIEDAIITRKTFLNKERDSSFKEKAQTLIRSLNVSPRRTGETESKETVNNETACCLDSFLDTPSVSLCESPNNTSSPRNLLSSRKTQSTEMSFYSVTPPALTEATCSSKHLLISKSDSDSETEGVCTRCICLPVFFPRKRRNFFTGV